MLTQTCGGWPLEPCVHVQHRMPVYVEANLASKPLSVALAECGFDASRPAVFTCEGLLYYLPPAAVDAFFADWGAFAAAGKPVSLPVTLALRS